MSTAGAEADAAVRWEREHGRGKLETILVCSLVGLLIAAILTFYYERIVLEAKRSALKVSLANIRLSTDLYRVLNDRYPRDLKDLLAQRYLIPTREGTIFNDQYLKDQAIDRNGDLIDPFGAQYRYEPTSGQITSSTPGYQDW